MVHISIEILITEPKFVQHLQGLDEAVLRNIQAVKELTDLVRTSFGPNGAFRISIYPFIILYEDEQVEIN